ncbi:MAG: glutamate synthase large subunit, partial [Dokdonella sp.]
MTPLQTTGLYDPAFEHDSCGFGLIANIDGNASGWLVDQAFAALAKMSHRGGVNSDGITGDGCGVLVYRAETWLRTLAREASIEIGSLYAAGLVFLDRDAAKADAAAQQLERCLREEGVHAAGWRDVPVTDEPCGPLGRASRPCIRQIFVNAAEGMDEAVF